MTTKKMTTKKMTTKKMTTKKKPAKKKPAKKKPAKKKPAKKKPAFCVSSSVEFLTKFLEETTGNTYPIKTLRRRLALLAPEERVECEFRWKMIEEMALKIEWTIATRAQNSFDALRLHCKFTNT